MHRYKMTLQEIVIESESTDDSTLEMYYRCSRRLCKGEYGEYLIKKGEYIDLSTYFNSFSLEKWKTYTKANEFALELTMEGDFQIEVFGHYVNNRGAIQKEWLGRYFFDLEDKQAIEIELPVDVTSSTVIAFQITAIKKTKFYDGQYVTYINPDEVAKPYICMATTTYRKES